MRKLPTGNFVAFCDSRGIENMVSDLTSIVTVATCMSKSIKSYFTDTWVQASNQQKMGLPRSTAVTPDGTLAPVGSPDFNKYLVERLHNPHIVQPRPPQDSRGYEKRVRVPSACSQRAKRGHKYWVDDKKHKLSPPGEPSNHLS